MSHCKEGSMPRNVELTDRQMESGRARRAKNVTGPFRVKSGRCVFANQSETGTWGVSSVTDIGSGRESGQVIETRV